MKRVEAVTFVTAYSLKLSGSYPIQPEAKAKSLWVFEFERSRSKKDDE